MMQYYNCLTSCSIFPNLNSNPPAPRAIHFSGTALPLTLDTATGTTRSSSKDLKDSMQ